MVDFNSKIKCMPAYIQASFNEDLAQLLEGYQAAADNGLSIVLDPGELDIILNAIDVLLLHIALAPHQALDE